MFFEQKDILIKHLDYFINSKDRYVKLGIPHTLGIMLYGQPGTGKTSCIKAIANYTNRDLICVPTKFIDTSEHLSNLFTFLPKQYIFVFEEIDCGSWREIVWSRDLIKEDKNIKDCHIDGLTICALCESLNKETKKEETDVVYSKLTLVELLERLDGIHEDQSRMIIFTTNKPEILDPALLRPGRIDISIEMKKMRRCDIADMYRLWFDIDISFEILNQILDYKFTQAEIGQIFLTHGDVKSLNYLIK